jgi:hypothetical protein
MAAAAAPDWSAAQAAKTAGDAIALAATRSSLRGRAAADTHAYDAAYAGAVAKWLEAALLCGFPTIGTDAAGRSAMAACRAYVHTAPLKEFHGCMRGGAPVQRAALEQAWLSVERILDASGDARRPHSGTGLTPLQFFGAAWPCIASARVHVPTDRDSDSSGASAEDGVLEQNPLAALALPSEPSAAALVLLESLIEMVAHTALAGTCWQGRFNRTAQALSLGIDLALLEAPRDA